MSFPSGCSDFEDSQNIGRDRVSTNLKSGAGKALAVVNDSTKRIVNGYITGTSTLLWEFVYINVVSEPANSPV